jgi:heme exporter protein CcmD
MIEWMNMDGDGIYVWPCYLLTLIVLIANIWVARSQHRALLKRATVRARSNVGRAKPGQTLSEEAAS